MSERQDDPADDDPADDDPADDDPADDDPANDDPADDDPADDDPADDDPADDDPADDDPADDDPANDDPANDDPADDDPHAGAVEPLLLDRVDALRLVTAASDAERGRLLEEIGGPGQVEQDIVDQLSKVKPLWQPEEFDEAHRLAMRSLEVLDRNGSRNADLPRLGPIRPVAQWIVQLLTRWIVKSYVNGLVTSIRKLYERREANSIWGSPAQVMLRRARINAEQVEQGFKGNPIGIPTFLLGGALLSTIVSSITSAISAALADTIGSIGLGIVIVVVLGSLSWAAVYAAAVARRRIRLTTDQPIRALYDAIGAAGDPPRDQSYNFSVIAIVLLVAAIIVIPAIALRIANL